MRVQRGSRPRPDEFVGRGMAIKVLFPECRKRSELGFRTMTLAVIDDDDGVRQALARLLRSVGRTRDDRIHVGSDDSERFYEACIVRCDGDKILSIVRDITDHKRAELEAAAQRRELAHLGRVAVLGELTGALAHELSQPLASVLSNAQAARHFVDRHPLDVAELRAALDDIIKDNKRAGAVIYRLRALLRKDGVALQPVDMNDVVREVIDLAHSEVVSRRITVTSALTPEIPPVFGDRTQLQQVVLNLVMNACDAMGRHAGGKATSGACDEAGGRLRPARGV